MVDERLSGRQNDIVAALNLGPLSAYELCKVVALQENIDSIPAASLRRDIQVVRKHGYDIRNEDQQYVLIASPVQPASIASSALVSAEG